MNRGVAFRAGQPGFALSRPFGLAISARGPGEGAGASGRAHLTPPSLP